MTTAGVERTAEELGQAFAGVRVISSTHDAAVAEVGPKSALVVAAPGAEPVAEGGYVAALLLDGWALLGRRDLRAGEEALRHWLNAAALVRPADQGGTVVVVADPGLAPVHALVQWDPVWHARRELEDRSRLHHPPSARIAELTGTREAVAEELKILRLPPGAEVLGPVPVLGAGPAPDQALTDAPGETHRALIRVPRRLGTELAAAVREAQDARGARRSADHDPVRVRIDPIGIG
jgi:primosomal protein N' (replication factor Y)